MGHGEPVFLYDAGSRRRLPLPPPAEGPVLLSPTPAPPSPTIGDARAALTAEALRRLLVWKGYEVVRGLPPLGDGCPASAAGRVCVHVAASPPADVTGTLCHMVVDVVWISRFSMYLSADWHRERRLPTLDELADLGVSLPDVALGLLLSGHYRRPRKVDRTDLRRGIAFRDAPTVRRRWARLTERLEPLPEIRSRADAVALLSPDGRRVLARFDAAMSGDLNTPVRWRCCTGPSGTARGSLTPTGRCSPRPPARWFR